jgi:short-subunit dehydrogenase
MPITNKNYNAAIITGASSGIGAAIATELCKRNITVIAVGRNRKNLINTKNRISKKQQNNFKILVADIKKNNDLERIIKLAKQYDARLLINNAGLGTFRNFEEQNIREIKETIETNLIGTAILTNKFLKAFKDNVHIVFVSSLSGKIGFPGLSIYTATKFGIEGLIETLRRELNGKKIRITTLRPGITDTNFFNRSGMTNFLSEVKAKSKIHSPEYVAKLLISEIDKDEITVSSDKLFIRLLPFIPDKLKFSVLEILNNYQKEK